MRGLIQAALLLSALYGIGCGVKGDPLPPEKPTEIGRGKPTYRRAAERINLAPQTPVEEEPQEEQDEADY